ncbi:MoaD/ThiS family protein [Alkalisalibacterium limincola]|uniref:Molybdopterin synthase sulfur carrier subunit n=1 Tax=Alkalisalibacterium limincola TaxID=2699169 RepID=A0A5C8KRV5_9GAMM|nr:MoaD/ThiS family protein [Alkalisalibacterium limincola]TXK62220.1 MoaD/ThiS family protein [Alkalisalibacterium limincola]
MAVHVSLQYFASLRDRTGVANESVTTDAATLAELYAQCDESHRLGWPIEKLRVACDGEFAQWSDPVHDGARVAFIPPVSGG